MQSKIYSFRALNSQNQKQNETWSRVFAFYLCEIKKTDID